MLLRVVSTLGFGLVAIALAVDPVAVSADDDRQEPRAFAMVGGSEYHCDPITGSYVFVASKGLAVGIPNQQASVNMWVITDNHSDTDHYLFGGANHRVEWVEILLGASCIQAISPSYCQEHVRQKVFVLHVGTNPWTGESAEDTDVFELPYQPSPARPILLDLGLQETLMGGQRFWSASVAAYSWPAPFSGSSYQSRVLQTVTHPERGHGLNIGSEMNIDPPLSSLIHETWLSMPQYRQETWNGGLLHPWLAYVQEEHRSPVPYFWGHGAPNRFCTYAQSAFPCPQGSGPYGARGSFPAICPPPPATSTPIPSATATVVSSTSTPSPTGYCDGLDPELLCSAALHPEIFVDFCLLSPESDECRAVKCNCVRNHQESCFQLCEIGQSWACSSLTATPPVPTPTDCPPIQ